MLQQSSNMSLSELWSQVSGSISKATAQPVKVEAQVPTKMNEFTSLLIRLAISTGLSIALGKVLMDMMDPTRKEKKEAKKRAEELMKRIGVNNVKLTEYELCFAADLVEPASLDVSWKDIGGLDHVIRSIKETVIFPFIRRDLFKDSYLMQPPKVSMMCSYLRSTFFTEPGEQGLLLHGPPGCGKTMVAKAIAKDAGARFINFKISSMVDKWYGESQKRAEAVFSLAMKLQPAIIFIDEIDSFLRSRSSQDHEATAMIKAQFMSMWDGIITDPNCLIMIIAATNRPSDIDPAILRRLPCQFNIKKPEKLQRVNILKLVLYGERTEDLDYEKLGEETVGLTGSDLKELCRVASTNRIRELVQNSHTDNIYEMEIERLRPITMKDMEIGIAKLTNSKSELLTLITESVD
ncbi:outer mitochondrial transmembrane helix translocase-like isoform X1 [Ostrea edulis]|uniref:outer mitochondrial transmembrane helix translocase-like isoform X1 n=1 Tax=Ostrea edulis TaxID=37623 RepID=UPI00209645B1|nr:outer mitochondrial transmembrane helix translocase-like isoform X1 [Ostrea edulis]